MLLTEVLKEFEILNRLEEDEGQSHENAPKHKRGEPPFFDEPNPCEMALSAFLEALPDEYVIALAVLFHAGRDKEPDPLACVGKLRTAILTKERAIESLMEKHSRMKFIRAAIDRIASHERLNNLPKTIATS